MNRTVARLQLTWYWPGIVAEVRRLLMTCKVWPSQKEISHAVAESGSTPADPGKRWH